MTLSQIRAAGLAALTKALGPVGMVRFLQQYDAGEGDYTMERKQWLRRMSVEEILAERQQRVGQGT